MRICDIFLRIRFAPVPSIFFMKKAFITGITGQDGSYLAELLLDKGYKVYGLQRRSSTANTERIDHLYDNARYKNFITVYGDLSDSSNLNTILSKIVPDEIYNLAAQSHVKVGFQIPEYTANITALGALRLLEIIRQSQLPIKFYQASSSEMFGKVTSTELQNEQTVFHPQSPYGLSKVFAYHITRIYRESYGMFACNGILFNHESPRRGITFVTRKITIGLSRIKLGLQDTLYLGNLDAKRDWGYAKDYVDAIFKIIHYKKPDDFVIATGQTHTVREFINVAAQALNIPLMWVGKGIAEKGIHKRTKKIIVQIDPQYFRPNEVDFLLGDSSKAKNELKWQPAVNFEQLVQLMVLHDFETLKQSNRSKHKVAVKTLNIVQ